MTVRELNRAQLDELKGNLYYQFRYDEDRRDELGDSLTEREQAFLLHVNTCYWEIPDEMVFKVYDWIEFVEDDFFCGKEEER